MLSRILLYLAVVALALTGAAHVSPGTCGPQRDTATVWYLGHCGYAVKWQERLLIFDYWEKSDGRDEAGQDSPHLSDGYVNPEEISDMPVYVFVTHSHSDHYDPVVHGWEDRVNDITYFFGWKATANPDHFNMIGPRAEAEVDGMKVYTVNSHHSGVPEVAYLVVSEGLVIYHNGDYMGDYERDYEYLAEKVDHIDLFFTGAVADRGSQYFQQARHIVTRFEPLGLFPMHYGGQEARYEEYADDALRNGLLAPIKCPATRGERFLIPIERHAYLGQTPPGLKPEPFAPGILPDRLAWHSAPVFSPDGKEMYFSSFVSRARYSETIFRMRMIDGEWTGPEVAPFSGQHFEGGPCLTPDGGILFYSSSRSGGPGGDPGQNRCLHYVERQGGGWGEPVKVPIRSGSWTDRPHFSELGNLYYTTGGDLYRVGFADGEYTMPERLPGEINTEAYGELDPCIAPDESFIIFYSSRPGGYSSESADLYVSYRTEDGGWTDAVNMGPEINGGCMIARFPKLSPDGKYLFFSRSSGPFGDEIYWVSLDYIKAMRQ